MCYIVKIMFINGRKSKVKLVRLACHFEELNKTVKICKLLQRMNYKVAINLMQISEQSEEKILAASK